MKKVADIGSDAARFAFEGVKIAFSKIDGLQELIDSIMTYPVKDKQKKIYNFFYQQRHGDGLRVKARAREINTCSTIHYPIWSCLGEG